MTEQTLRERMNSYEAAAGYEYSGRVRYFRLDTAEFCDWLNGLSALEFQAAEAKCLAYRAGIEAAAKRLEQLGQFGAAALVRALPDPTDGESLNSGKSYSTEGG